MFCFSGVVLYFFSFLFGFIYKVGLAHFHRPLQTKGPNEVAQRVEFGFIYDFRPLFLTKNELGLFSLSFAVDGFVSLEFLTYRFFRGTV